MVVNLLRAIREMLNFPFICFTSLLLLGRVNGVMILEELRKRIADLQIKKTTPFDYPFSVYKQKGLYPSNIQLNFCDFPEADIIRNSIKFFDNNAFVTSWISSILLEVARFDPKNHPSDEQLISAIKAVSTYQDRNYPPNSSILVFWTETYNGSTGTWTCGPVNLKGIAKDDERLADYVEKILKDIGLESLWNRVAPLIDYLLSITAAFAIPADFDDTFINIGFGSLLKSYQNISAKPFKAWKANNTRLIKAIEALKLYAYRPFSNSLDTNLIDTRTYFYMRDFLYSVNGANRPLALVPTWIQNISALRRDFSKNYRMPFNANNIDLTVSANALYGLTAALLNDMLDDTSWFDEDVQMIYENTTYLIFRQIANNFTARPDLALLYYPSVFNFYWFTSRILNLLDSADQLPPVLTRCQDMLSQVLRHDMTDQIVKMATFEDNLVYFDEFLGDDDKDILGRTVKHGDDRIHSTAMAVNALFYTWTSRGQLLTDMPDNVKEIIDKACQWLTKHAVSFSFRPLNAFFSGSVKGYADIPFFFPANIIQRLNGTLVPRNYNVSEHDHDLIVGVSGFISEDDYNKMLKEKQFNVYPPMDFHGYNSNDNSFPFWSSEAFTYAATLLALTQHNTFIVHRSTVDDE